MINRAYIKVPVSPHPWRCIDEDGARCPWIRASHFWQRWTCALFRQRQDLAECDTCLAKWPECIAASEKEHMP